MAGGDAAAFRITEKDDKEEENLVQLPLVTNKKILQQAFYRSYKLSLKVVLEHSGRAGLLVVTAT